MSFSIIVATSKNGVIGVNNELPWHLPEDMKHFKKNTIGKSVIMGRKTFESIGKPLPKRQNYVITRSRDYQPEGVIVVHSLEELLKRLPVNEEHMVIGGGEIYRVFEPFVDKIYHTLIECEVEGDTYFEIPNGFELSNEEVHFDGIVNNTPDVMYRFRLLVRNPE